MRLYRQLLRVCFVAGMLTGCGDDSPKSGYQASYDLCMSQPATLALPSEGDQKAHCSEYAYRTIHGTGSTPESKKTSANVSEASNTHAFKMCTALDKTGTLSEPCRVSGRTVLVKMNMSHLEAAKFCGGARDEMKKVGARFETGWTLTIESPFNGTKLAICDL